MAARATNGKGRRSRIVGLVDMQIDISPCGDAQGKHAVQNGVDIIELARR